MEQWLDSVYSDGTEEFVDRLEPKIGDSVEVMIRMHESAPVQAVFVRTVPNGAEHFERAEVKKTIHGLVYFGAKIKINEPRVHYQFYIVCEDVIYYVTQKGITTYIPDETYDFVLLTDYRHPSWIADAVFYQIFPDRFACGDPENGVRDGSYSFQGHTTIRRKNFCEKPYTYDKGFNLDFHGGDLKGIKNKIPYLKRLGVTALYINPIFKAPTTHKFDCVDFFHVDSYLGGDAALAELSDALHENGLRLILDISINHTGTAHKWFREKEPYYFFNEDGSYDGWCGNPDLPVLNYSNEKLHDIIYRDRDSVIRKWLKAPYSIDGWRFDVADVLARKDESQLDVLLWKELRKSIKEENSDAYILAEDWGDCGEHLQGDQWDSAMNYFGCGRVIRQFIGLQDLFNERVPELAVIPYKMTAKDFRNRVMEHLAKIPFALWLNQFNLIGSHDVGRIHNYPSVSQNVYEGAVILQFMLIGAPSIYYGDEAEIDGWTTNNEGFRFPMPWNRDFENCERFKFYQRMIHIRKSHKCMTAGGMKFIYSEGRILAIARFLYDEVIVAVVSQEEENKKIFLELENVGARAPIGNKDMFDKTIAYNKNTEGGIELNVEAKKAYIFKCRMV